MQEGASRYIASRLMRNTARLVGAEYRVGRCDEPPDMFSYNNPDRDPNSMSH